MKGIRQKRYQNLIKIQSRNLYPVGFLAGDSEILDIRAILMPLSKLFLKISKASRSVISREYVRLCADFRNNGKPINPTPFVLAVKKKHKNSKGGKQHDALEFLTKLLNSVPKKMVRDKVKFVIKSSWACQTCGKDKSHSAPSYILQ